MTSGSSSEHFRVCLCMEGLGELKSDLNGQVQDKRSRYSYSLKKFGGKGREERGNRLVAF